MSSKGIAEQIREMQRQLAEADATAARLRAELAAAREALLASGSFLPPPASRTVSKLNSTEMAEQILMAAGGPLHVNQIISGIEREYHVSVRYATLVGNISRLVKKRKTFERVGPNRFGLLVWADEREASELFGREEAERERRSYEG